MGDEQASVAIIGAGAWGTALAQHLASHGRRVTLWGRDGAILEEIRTQHGNPVYLPGVKLSPKIAVQPVLPDALAAGEIVVMAVPCVAMRRVVGEMAEHLGGRHRGLVWTCKGIEPPDGVFMHEILDEALGGGMPTACLSGPSFAAEVAVGKPTAVTLVSRSRDFALRAAELFHAGDFRVYPGGDVIGVEVAGALKNVIALAAGICDGLQLGSNARAALIARGLAEIGRLIEALGGQSRTLTGLAGVGDVVLTSTDDQSRNRRFGLAMVDKSAGAGEASTVEGVSTARAAAALTAHYKTQFPICTAVNDVLDGRATPAHAVKRLLEREMKSEE